MDLMQLLAFANKAGYPIALVIGLGWYWNNHPPKPYVWFERWLAHKKDLKLTEEQRLSIRADDLYRREIEITGLRNKLIETLMAKLDFVETKASKCHAESGEQRVLIANQQGEILLVREQSLSLALQNRALTEAVASLRKVYDIIEAVQKKHPEFLNAD